jgi:hypothetical protein
VVGRLVCPSDAGSWAGRAMEARHMKGQRLDKEQCLVFQVCG